MDINRLKAEWEKLTTREDKKEFYWRFVDHYLYRRHHLDFRELIAVREFGDMVERELNTNTYEGENHA